MFESVLIISNYQNCIFKYYELRLWAKSQLILKELSLSHALPTFRKWRFQLRMDFVESINIVTKGSVYMTKGITTLSLLQYS